MSDEKVGQIYGLFAFVFWGITPIYYKQISMIPPFEILAHRVIFSVFVLILLLSVSKQFHTIKPIFKSFIKMKYLIIASLLISVNWFTFIYAISVNKIVEASLGYFITPLVSIALGYYFFGERMNQKQKMAVALAFIALVYELVTLGTVPIIALVLAFSFGFYGMIRKKIQISSIPGLFIETIVVLPIALVYLLFLINNHTSAFNTQGSYDIFMLSLCGLVTVLPLLWFNKAATKMSMSMLGFMQYIGPSIAFLVGVFIYNEKLDFNKLLAFILIWIALVIYSFATIKKEKK